MSVRVKVRMYATVRELAGHSEAEVETESLEGLLKALGERFGPKFSALVRRGGKDEGVVILLNGRNVTASRGDLPLSQGDEVCIFPPVSGG